MLVWRFWNPFRKEIVFSRKFHFFISLLLQFHWRDPSRGEPALWRRNALGEGPRPFSETLSLYFSRCRNIYIDEKETAFSSSSLGSRLGPL